MSDTLIKGVRPKVGNFLETVATAGGSSLSIDFLLGYAGADHVDFMGLILGGQWTTLKSKLDEVGDQKDSFIAASLFVERWDLGNNKWNLLGANNSTARDMRGFGFGKFCSAGGDQACWASFVVESTSSTGLLWNNRAHDIGFALDIGLNTQTYLHLTSEDQRRQYPHSTLAFGLGASASLYFGQAGVDYAENESPTTIEHYHEIVKYFLDDLALIFSATQGSDHIQKGQEFLEEVGLSGPATGPMTEPTATTGVGGLQALKSFSAASGKIGHFKFNQRMNADSRTPYFIGNVLNSIALLVTGLGKDSDAFLQGGLSALQHTASLIPDLKEASPMASYVTRLIIPHVLSLGGLLASDAGTQQAFFSTAAEGWMGLALHPGKDKDLVRSKTYSYSIVSPTTEKYDTVKLKGQRSELAIETQLSSGLSIRMGVASPAIAAGNANVVKLGENLSDDLGITEGNGAAYEDPTLSTTVSNMLGWRGAVGEQLQFTGSIFAGTATNMGPAAPQLGLAGRASAGLSVGFGKDFGFQLGAEGFVGAAKFPDHSTTEYGFAVMATIR